jgi:geranylgeranyl pyrophosphate synthase
VAWREQLPILAAVELLNISTYQSNYCFDEKAGVETTSERNNQFICSMLTISKLTALIESCDGVQGIIKLGIASLLAQSNHEVYQGQFCDLNVLNLDRASEFLHPDAFLPMYATRCDLIAGSTFRACTAGALINGPPMKAVEALYDYFGALGAAAQAVNDLGDYIPYVTKDYAEPFSDFQLGRLTLPAFLLHQAGLPLNEWRRALRAEGTLPNVGKILTEALQDLKIEEQVRKFVQARFFPKIRASLATLESLFGPERSAPFWFAYPYIFDSRLLRYFRPDRSRSWPTTGGTVESQS